MTKNFTFANLLASYCLILSKFFEAIFSRCPAKSKEKYQKLHRELTKFQMFHKIAVSKNFAKFTGKYLQWSAF